MNIRKELGIYYINFTEKTFMHFYNEWAQLFRDNLWYTITIVQIEIEKDNVISGWEFKCMLFGIGFRIRINGDLNSTEAGKVISTVDKRINENI